MESIRRISALVIALSLALPQHSCMNGGHLEIYYPLSNADAFLSIVVISALYMLPLIILLIPRFRVASLVAGIATAATGLYYISYGATIAATSLMVGWYTYTLGTVAYLLASLFQLKRALMPNNLLKPDTHDGPGP